MRTGIGCWRGGSAVQGRGARCPTLAVALGGSHRPGGIGVGKARQALLAIHRHAPVLLVVEIDLEPVPKDEAFSDIVRSGSHVFTVRFPARAGRVTPIQPSAQARSRVTRPGLAQDRGHPEAQASSRKLSLARISFRLEF